MRSTISEKHERQKNEPWCAYIYAERQE
jgi:hypothetical protein